jgi:hypothetical protein
MFKKGQASVWPFVVEAADGEEALLRKVREVLDQ